MIILKAHLASCLPAVKLHIHDPSPLLNSLAKLGIGCVHKFIDGCSIKPTKIKWLGYEINHKSHKIPLPNQSITKVGAFEETVSIIGFAGL